MRIFQSQWISSSLLKLNSTDKSTKNVQDTPHCRHCRTCYWHQWCSTQSINNQQRKMQIGTLASFLRYVRILNPTFCWWSMHVPGKPTRPHWRPLCRVKSQTRRQKLQLPVWSLLLHVRCFNLATSCLLSSLLSRNSCLVSSLSMRRLSHSKIFFVTLRHRHTLAFGAPNTVWKWVLSAFRRACESFCIVGRRGLRPGLGTTYSVTTTTAAGRPFQSQISTSSARWNAVPRPSMDRQNTWGAECYWLPLSSKPSAYGASRAECSFDLVTSHCAASDMVRDFSSP